MRSLGSKKVCYNRAWRTHASHLESTLQEELGAREDGFGLVQGLHLLCEGVLAGLEILHQKVARLVQIRLLILQLLLLVQSRGLGLLLGREINLGLRLLTGLVGDRALLLLDRRVRVLHERLVGLLRVLCFSS